jgi:hydrogenase-4 component E
MTPAVQPALLPQLVSLLSFAVVAVGLGFVWRQSLPARLRLFAAQSVLLAVLAGVVGAFTGRRELGVVALAHDAGRLGMRLLAVGLGGELGVVALAVLVVKGWTIPRILARVAPPAARPRVPARSPAGLLLGAGALVLAAYAVMLPVTAGAALPTAAGLPLALATGFIGLLVCVTARRALTQVLGFLVFENGVFMLALLATYGLPALVEAGAFLDLLVAVLIMKVVLGEIQESFESTDIDQLQELRG